MLVTLAKGSVKVQTRITAVEIPGEDWRNDTYRVHIDVGTELDTKVPPCALGSSAHGDISHVHCFNIIDFEFDLNFECVRGITTVAARDVLVPLSNPHHTATLHIAFFLMPQGKEWSSEFTLDLYGFCDAQRSRTAAVRTTSGFPSM